MLNSLVVQVLLFLSLFFTAAVAVPEQYVPGPILTIRQTAASSTDPQCLEYSRIANLSTIGANSTYRSAFLQASPAGTLGNGQMLNAAIAKLPALMVDAALNQQCGNLSTIAVTEAAKNFSNGIVAQFSNVDKNPQAIKAGPELLVIVIVIIMITGGMWSTMP
jgi:hypothetical protein